MPFEVPYICSVFVRVKKALISHITKVRGDKSLRKIGGDKQSVGCPLLGCHRNDKSFRVGVYWISSLKVVCCLLSVVMIRMASAVFVSNIYEFAFAVINNR